jgi:NAD(P)-dependent dehydrogenase (short-subunit alcohol dehydrogenase family)
VVASLRDQVAIVTGAGRGLGLQIARRTARAGAHVVLVARTAADVERGAAEIEDEGGRALAWPADITKPDDVTRLVAEVAKQLGRIDVLVNNAATTYVANLVMAKADRWRELYELNVFALVAVTQAVVKHMIRRKSGRIINIGSVSAELGASYYSAYASSKAAVDGFTRSLAREVAKLGITVNSIRPWHIEAEGENDAMAARAKMFGKTTEEYVAQIVAESPQQRLITADEVAGLAVFLMSDDARGIHGQTLNVCGGYSM